MPLQFETIFGMALVAGGLTICLVGVRHAWRAGTVLRAPRVGEPEAANAPIVRLDGTVEDAIGDPIEAPFSGTAAVVVRHVVEERQLNPGVWILSWDVVVEEGVESVPFEVRSDGGSAVTIDGAIGTALLDSEPVATVGSGDDLPRRIAAFHEEAGLSREPLIFGSLPGPLAGIGRLVGLGKRTYGEERLEPGDDVTIVGHPIDGAPGEAIAADDGLTLDPLVVSRRSAWRAVLSMAKTGLVAVVLGVAVVAFGVVLLVL